MVLKFIKVETGKSRYAPVQLWQVLLKYCWSQMNNTGHGKNLCHMKCEGVEHVKWSVLSSDK